MRTLRWCLMALVGLCGCESGAPGGEQAEGDPATGLPSRDASCLEGTWIAADARGPKASKDEILRGGSDGMRIIGHSGGARYTFTGDGAYRVEAEDDQSLIVTISSKVRDELHQNRVEIRGELEGRYVRVDSAKIRLLPPTKSSINAKASVQVGDKTVDLPKFRLAPDTWHGLVEVSCQGKDKMTLRSVESARFFDGLSVRRI